MSATGDVVVRAEAQRTLVEHVLALDEPWRSTVLLRYGSSEVDLGEVVIPSRTSSATSCCQERA